MTQVARFALLAVVMLVTPCGSSSQATAISSPASTPSAAESVAPPLNVIATAEDYTGKPPPVGAIVMTMSDLTFHPSTPAGTGSKVVIYIDNQDPRKPDCGAVGGAGSTCNQHALLVLGPGDRCWARLGSAPATSEDVLASLQRLHQVCSDALEVASQSGNLIQLALASRELRAALEVLGRQIERLEARRGAPVIDFFTSRDWQTVNGIFMEVLGAYPEAKKALVARLRALNADAVKEDPDG